MLHVAYCFDKNYQQYFGASLTSLLLNFDGPGEDLCIHVVTDTLDSDFLAKVEHLRQVFRATIKTYSPAPESIQSLTGLMVQREKPTHLTQASYYRLLLPQLLPESVDRVLYLDSDTVVLSSVRAVFDEDVEESALAAVPDIASEKLSSYWSLDRYINSGVMLMNLKRWREHGYARQCIEFVAQNAVKCRLLDQDAINAMLAGDIRLLPSRWNMQVISDCLDVTPLDVGIVHFIGGSKPWHEWYGNPLGKHYWQYLNASPWRGADPVPPRSAREARRLAKRLWRDRKYGQAVVSYLGSLGPRS